MFLTCLYLLRCHIEEYVDSDNLVQFWQLRGFNGIHVCKVTNTFNH